LNSFLQLRVLKAAGAGAVWRKEVQEIKDAVYETM